MVPEAVRAALHELEVHVSNTVRLVTVARLLVFGRGGCGRRGGGGREDAGPVETGLVQDFHRVARGVRGRAGPAAGEAVAEGHLLGAIGVDTDWGDGSGHGGGGARARSDGAGGRGALSQGRRAEDGNGGEERVHSEGLDSEVLALRY